MTHDEKESAIQRKQLVIDNLPYHPVIDYPYCCMCFCRLTADNIFEDESGLWDNCLECKP